MEKNINYIRESLKEAYRPEEIDVFVFWILNFIKGYSKIDIHLNKKLMLSASEEARVKQIVERLQNMEPIQYIIGETEFCGLKLSVTPDVLIPRPETEEIVEIIRKELTNSDIRILDVGTGSGCIALSLKSYLPSAKIFACDVSKQALNVAKSNAFGTRLDVTFFAMDILDTELKHNRIYDVIISNPPYVRKSEAALMMPNVLDFEPHLALFVEDDDPLIFYRAIVWFANNHLSENGRLYFEINEALGSEVKLLLEENNYKQIEICDDLEGKERMVKAIKGK